MNNEFVSIGEILIDFTPAGKSATGSTLFQQNLGGAPGNVACAMAKLGRRSAFLGMAGDDGFGRFCKNTLAKMGVDARGLKLSPVYNTTLAFVHLSDAGDRSFSFYRKNSADINMTKDDLDMSVATGADIFHFGGVSLSDEPSRSTTVYAAREAQKSGSIISFDPNIRAALWESEAEIKTAILNVLPIADVVKFSDEEITFVFGTKDYPAAIRHIRERFGTKLVIVTRGPRGALTVVNGKPLELPAYDVKTIDTTGSGDCFFAGVLHCLLTYGKPADSLTESEVEYLLKFANAAGSLASTKMGAVSALPNVDEIECCINQEKELLL